MTDETPNSRTPKILTGVFFVVWLIAVATWKYFTRLADSHAWVAGFYWGVFAATIPLGLFWWWRVRQASAVRRRAVATFIGLMWWQFSVFASDAMGWEWVRSQLALWGTIGTFFIGLAWLIWTLECIERRHWLAALDGTEEPPQRVWNPLRQDAWFYGRRSQKLNQSLSALMSYVMLFFAGYMLLTQVGGCSEVYELPAGGGQQQPIAQVVKVQKKIRQKFVVNPLSALKFKVPPIDEVQVITQDLTKHAYTVGYGQGEGAGFAGGTQKGKVRFIRLEYSGGDWNQDFGVGADENILIEYGIRTGQKVAAKTEARRVAELKNFPIGKSPPLVFLTGQKNISLSNGEIKILREYLLDKHGMLFVDNGGSRHFHNQVLHMMHQVLPNVREVPVPLDDVIHRIPYPLPFLPYVAPHGGKEALGWKVDGRWVCYYHPGDIADAWADDHAGVKPTVWEACYQLGTNIIFYAHSEYAKWLAARQEE